ncbi:MAG: hypothetical protein DWP92_05570 [Armatimonadetes bacterium]|nr:MAG: hypothetical protein DWP92_05570 [Armatimonadota bacterium]
MAARFEDAAAGWEVYKSLHGEVSLPEINEAIRAQGFSAVAQRTYSHYEKLARLGYEEYLSINRLDLRHASSSVFDFEDRSRYSDRPLNSPATLLIPSSTDVDRLEGQVTRVSEGFATFVAASSPSARRIGKSRKYNRGVLVFERVRVERAIALSESVEIDGSVRMLLVFRSLLETDLVFPDMVGPTSTERLRVPLGDDPSLFSVVTVFRRSFDLYESLRGFVDLYVSAVTPGQRPVLASPRVRRLSVGSPFELDLVGSPLVWPAVALMIKVVVPVVTSAVRDVQQFRTDSAEEKRHQDRHPLEMESLQLENLKQRIEIAQLIDVLEPATREYLGLDDRGGSPELNADRLEALKNQAVEAAAEIAVEATSDIELHPLDDDSDGS